MTGNVPQTENPENSDAEWVRAADAQALAEAGRLIFKAGGKQILLIQTRNGPVACNNRCPHEGFPLMEGSLDASAQAKGGCALTCNWHNWKFDLATGQSLYGGDGLRLYPLEQRGDDLWIDLADPPPGAMRDKALENLREAFGDYDYERIAREVARYRKAGGDPARAVAQAIRWSHDRYEFGMTHGFGAAEDWLNLSERHATDEAERLVPVVEVLAHMAYDTLRQPEFPFNDKAQAYDAEALLEAIEAEDEPRAVALIRGALWEGMRYEDLRPTLARAALAHYNDFGHSVIYTYKTGALIGRLGPEVMEPLLFALVRELIFATREERLPEFRLYAGALARWGEAGDAVPSAEDFLGANIGKALKLALAGGRDPEALYAVLLEAAALNILHFDLGYDRRHDLTVSNNIGWLDFTHAITFANAGRVLARETPDLWPPLLLQMALFVGRNAKFIDRDLNREEWVVADGRAFLDEAKRGLFDHGQFRHIVSAHLVKLTTAVEQEIAAAPDAAPNAAPNATYVPVLLAALNRFLNSPFKQRHALRAAKQAVSFVAAEG